MRQRLLLTRPAPIHHPTTWPPPPHTHTYPHHHLSGVADSVAPQYAPYMRARAWQYLFGGALSVFTTRR